jgi:acetyl-CoA acetyltransferase
MATSSAAIVGIGATEYTNGSDGRPGLELALEAITLAVADAGLDVKDIDGILKYNLDPSASHEMLISNLGVDLALFAETPIGGAAIGTMTQIAESAVATGQAEVVVCFRAFTPEDYGAALRHNTAWLWARQAGLADFVRPYGWGNISQSFAFQFQRHMHEYGTKEEHLGAIVQACTRHGSMNPAALRGTPVSIDEYLKMPYSTSPLREMDCFIMPCAGACAYVVTSAERARTLRQPPAYVAAAASGSTPLNTPNWEEWALRQGPAATTAADQVAPRLWKRSGLKPEDVDVAQIYDCYSYSVITQLESYGFCERGEGGPFVEGGRIEIGGDMPVNTSGGHLSESYIHGFNHVLEAVRQIRGTSTAQVPDAEVSMATGGPGPLTSAAIFTKEPV